jgi:hypothetical protein
VRCYMHEDIDGMKKEEIMCIEKDGWRQVACIEEDGWRSLPSKWWSWIHEDVSKKKLSHDRLYFNSWKNLSHMFSIFPIFAGSSCLPLSNKIGFTWIEVSYINCFSRMCCVWIFCAQVEMSVVLGRNLRP